MRHWMAAVCRSRLTRCLCARARTAHSLRWCARDLSEWILYVNTPIYVQPSFWAVFAGICVLSVNSHALGADISALSSLRHWHEQQRASIFARVSHARTPRATISILSCVVLAHSAHTRTTRASVSMSVCCIMRTFASVYDKCENTTMKVRCQCVSNVWWMLRRVCVWVCV